MSSIENTPDAQPRYRIAPSTSTAFKLHGLDRPANDESPSGNNQHHVRQCIEPALHRLGLYWEDDVHEVYPVVGTMTWAWMKELPFYHKVVIMTSVSDPRLVREALELCLSRWPIFRSLAVEYSENLRLLVALRAQRSFFDRAISTHPEVGSVEALEELPIHVAPQRTGMVFQGLPFGAVIAQVRSTGTIGVIFSANHAVYDGRSLRGWMIDLDRILRSESPVNRAPYKLFADAYYSYQDSALAKEGQEHHKGVLKHGPALFDALWPFGKDLVPVRTTAKGNSSRLSSNPIKELLDQSAPQNISHATKFAESTEQTRICPNMTDAYKNRGMRASTVVKMAICLFNCLQTGKEYAIFTVFTGGETWPFIHQDIAAHLPSPYRIAGPTMTSQVTVTKIDYDETINQFFARIKEEQNLSLLHQHVPRRLFPQIDEMCEGLGPQASRQVFDWIPEWEKTSSTGGDQGQNNFRVLPSAHKNGPPPGVVWLCRRSGDDSLMVRLNWNPALFPKGQAAAHVSLIHDLVEWICDPGNGEKRIEEVCKAFQCMGSSLKRASLSSKL